jgi:hypothetical protein
MRLLIYIPVPWHSFMRLWLRITDLFNATITGGYGNEVKLYKGLASAFFKTVAFSLFMRLRPRRTDLVSATVNHNCHGTHCKCGSGADFYF